LPAVVLHAIRQFAILGQQQATGLGEFEIVFGTGEQLDTQLALQPLDVAAERWLRQMQTPGGLREVQAFGGLQECLEFCEIKHRPTSFVR
jgi:hypothetical protein